MHARVQRDARLLGRSREDRRGDPREIEEFLYGHPDIVDAQVAGVSDEKYGEELMVWLRVREGAEAPTPESLRAISAGRIAHHKIPRYVQGKVRKVELRERGEALLGES